jgi:hypothetical protein
MINPAKLKLPAGTHLLELRSMLLTATSSFTSN